jgi:hypothetical protein
MRRTHNLPDGLEWPDSGLHLDTADGDVWILTPSDAFCLEPDDAYELGEAMQALSLEASDVD